MVNSKLPGEFQERYPWYIDADAIRDFLKGETPIRIAETKGVPVPGVIDALADYIEENTHHDLKARRNSHRLAEVVEELWDEEAYILEIALGHEFNAKEEYSVTVEPSNNVMSVMARTEEEAEERARRRFHEEKAWFMSEAEVKNIEAEPLREDTRGATHSSEKVSIRPGDAKHHVYVVKARGTDDDGWTLTQPMQNRTEAVNYVKALESYGLEARLLTYEYQREEHGKEFTDEGEEENGD